MKSLRHPMIVLTSIIIGVLFALPLFYLFFSLHPGFFCMFCFGVCREPKISCHKMKLTPTSPRCVWSTAVLKLCRPTSAS